MPIGKLYIVATPIGNLEDISARAINILNQVDWIAAEDTRHSAKLLAHCQITTPMFSLHEFNEIFRQEKVIGLLQQGQSIALISDAGTPLISDPGYRLVHEARNAGIEIVPIPGPCALIAALSVSGLPTDRFIFEGFLPVKRQARIHYLKTLKTEPRTLIFYEAPHRIVDALHDFLTVFGGERLMVVARELTKIHETVLTDNLENITKYVETHPEVEQGEWVILLKGAEPVVDHHECQETHLMHCLLEVLPVKQAAAVASKITGKKKNALYKLALSFKS